MRPYTMDLRERVAAAVDDGDGRNGRSPGCSASAVSFVSRLLKRRRETGTLAPEPHRGGPRRVLEHRREVPALGPGQGAQRLHPGGAQAGRRLRLLPDDDLARPAAARPDPQEEVDARRRARPARRQAEAAVVPVAGCGGSSPGGCNSSTSRGRTRR